MNVRVDVYKDGSDKEIASAIFDLSDLIEANCLANFCQHYPSDEYGIDVTEV